MTHGFYYVMTMTSKAIFYNFCQGHNLNKLCLLYVMIL